MFDGAVSTKDHCWEMVTTANKEEKLSGWCGEVRRFLDRLQAMEDYTRYEKDMARIADSVTEAAVALSKLRYELAEVGQMYCEQLKELAREAEKDDWRA